MRRNVPVNVRSLSSLPALSLLVKVVQMLILGRKRQYTTFLGPSKIGI